MVKLDSKSVCPRYLDNLEPIPENCTKTSVNCAANCRLPIWRPNSKNIAAERIVQRTVSCLDSTIHAARSNTSQMTPKHKNTAFELTIFVVALDLTSTTESQYESALLLPQNEKTWKSERCKSEVSCWLATTNLPDRSQRLTLGRLLVLELLVTARLLTASSNLFGIPYHLLLNCMFDEHFHRIRLSFSLSLIETLCSLVSRSGYCDTPILSVKSSNSSLTRAFGIDTCRLIPVYDSMVDFLDS